MALSKIVGAAGRAKHEKACNDSRESITMYRLGSASDDSGPTIFLLKGTKKREGFTDKFLTDNGAKLGSTIIMTPTAFMTTDAWEEMSLPVCEGMRSVSV